MLSGVRALRQQGKKALEKLYGGDTVGPVHDAHTTAQHEGRALEHAASEEVSAMCRRCASSGASLEDLHQLNSDLAALRVAQLGTLLRLVARAYDGAERLGPDDDSSKDVAARAGAPAVDRTERKALATALSDAAVQGAARAVLGRDSADRLALLPQLMEEERRAAAEVQRAEEAASTSEAQLVFARDVEAVGALLDIGELREAAQQVDALRGRGEDDEDADDGGAASGDVGGSAALSGSQEARVQVCRMLRARVMAAAIAAVDGSVEWCDGPPKGGSGDGEPPRAVLVLRGGAGAGAAAALGGDSLAAAVDVAGGATLREAWALLDEGGLLEEKIHGLAATALERLLLPLTRRDCALEVHSERTGERVELRLREGADTAGTESGLVQAYVALCGGALCGNPSLAGVLGSLTWRVVSATLLAELQAMLDACPAAGGRLVQPPEVRGGAERNDGWDADWGWDEGAGATDGWSDDEGQLAEILGGEKREAGAHASRRSEPLLAYEAAAQAACEAESALLRAGIVPSGDAAQDPPRGELSLKLEALEDPKLSAEVSTWAAAATRAVAGDVDTLAEDADVDLPSTAANRRLHTSRAMLRAVELVRACRIRAEGYLARRAWDGALAAMADEAGRAPLETHANVLDGEREALMYANGCRAVAAWVADVAESNQLHRSAAAGQRLDQVGQGVLRGALLRRRAAVWEAIDAAGGLQDLSNGRNAIRARAAVRRAVSALAAAGRTWGPLLPAAQYARAASSLLSAACERAAAAVLSLEDIGADECDEIREAVSPLVEDGPGALALEGVSSSDVKKGARGFGRLAALVDILMLHMSDVMARWEAGALQQAGLSAAEVAGFLTAVFDRSAYLDTALARLQRDMVSEQ
ncbi:unnamed protein product [Pedinophyceae sp. YPF-701]|nr:unnamed protein product [Pedinophyceae sp. YPF-701]